MPAVPLIDREIGAADRLLDLRAESGVLGSWAARWDGVNSIGLVGAQYSGMETGGNDWLFSAWVMLDAPAAGIHVAGRWSSDGGSSGSSEWLLRTESVSGAIQYQLWGRLAGGGIVAATAIVPGGIQAGEWHHVACYHDRAANVLGVRVDDGEAGTVAASTALWAGNLRFHLGALNSAGGRPPIRMAGAAWARLAAGTMAARDDMIARLYNGGVGSDPRELPPARVRDWGLLAFWPLDEPSGGRRVALGNTALALGLVSSVAIGRAPGPVERPADDGMAASGWAPAGGVGPVFSVPADATGGPVYRADDQRLSVGATDRLEAPGSLLAARSAGTLSVVMSANVGAACLIYGEGPAADPDFEWTLDDDGRAVVTFKGGDGVVRTVVADVAGAVAGLREAVAPLGVTSLGTQPDSVPRSRCRAYVGPGHPFAAFDEVIVRGLGAPYDGPATIADVTSDSVAWVVANPAEAAPPGEDDPPPAIVGRGRAMGGETLTTPEAGTSLVPRRFVLTVRRKVDNTADLLLNGTVVGTGPVGPPATSPAGPSWIGTAPGRAPAFAGRLERIAAHDRALTDAECRSLAMGWSVRVSRRRGVGPLASFFDAWDFPGVGLTNASDHQFLWSFTPEGSHAPHDTWEHPDTGRQSARPSGPGVSQVFDSPGRYVARLAVVSPPWDADGEPATPTLIAAGIAATVEVEPWPEWTADLYVDPDHPEASDSGHGDDPDAPLATLPAAASKAARPYSRIRLRTGSTFPAGAEVDLSGRIGPVQVEPYGPEADGPPTVLASLRTAHSSPLTFRVTASRDLRLLGFILQDTGEVSGPTMAKLAWHGEGSTRSMLLRDLDCRGTHRINTPTYGDRGTTIDRCRLANRGDYSVLADLAHDLAVTRCDLLAEGVLHYLRIHNRECAHVAFNYRSEGEFVEAAAHWYLTLRRVGRKTVVTDNRGGAMHQIAGEAWHPGPAFGLAERNHFLSLSVGAGDSWTFRGNRLANALAWSDSPSANAGPSEHVRIYDNRREPGKATDLSLAAVAAYRASGPSPPTVRIAQATSAGLVLTADGFGPAASLSWSARDAGGAWSRIVGCDGMAALASPLPAGSTAVRCEADPGDGSGPILSSLALVADDEEEVEVDPPPPPPPPPPTGPGAFATTQPALAGRTLYAVLSRGGVTLATVPMAEGPPGRFTGSVPSGLSPGNVLVTVYRQLGPEPDPAIDWQVTVPATIRVAPEGPPVGGIGNRHRAHMVHRVAILANRLAGRSVRGGGSAEDWQPIDGGGSVPCLVTTDREWLDAQAESGRNAPEDVRRYKVAFTDPPADLGRQHRLVWDSPGVIAPRTLSVVTPLTPDPTGRLWTCGAEERGG